MLSAIEQSAYKSGFSEYGYVEIKNLNYHPEVRKICEENTCRNYGTSWACPPAIGTIEECRNRVNQYSKMLLFSKAYQLEDSFDFEGMLDGMRNFKQTVDIFQKKLDSIITDYLLLSNEGCGRCAECTYPDAPCRFPKLLHHSLEGYGFIVNDLAQDAGIRYHNGPDTVTYFGALLLNYSE